MDVPIQLVAGTLPSGAVYNPQTYFDAIVARMTATVSGGNILFGQLGGGEPTSPLPGNGSTPGLWFGNSNGNSGIWQSWNTDAAKYLPIPVTCGQYVNGALTTTDILCGAITGSWKIVTPDKAGVIALTSDIPSTLGSRTLVGSNWTNRAPQYYVLAGNLTLAAPSNASDGQITDYFIENPTGTTDYTVTWWAAVNWPGGSAPTQSVHVSGQRVIDHYQVQFQGGSYFGRVIEQNYQIAIGSQTIVPTVVSLTAEASAIFIQFSANLLGNGAVPTGDFTVMVNGNAATVISAIADGLFCLVALSATLGASDTVTLQYAGTDLKSIQGNNVAGFGPSPVALANVGVPSAPGGGGGLFNHFLP